MKKNGFAPLIVILVIAILGIVGYFAYKNYSVRSQTPERETNLPITGVINGQKVTIDVSATVKTTIGTMTVLPGWQVSVNNDVGGPEGPVNKIKGIDINKGEYAIHITSFGSGRAVCSLQSQINGEIKTNNAVMFKDQDGTQYAREKLSSYSGQQLTVCSNGIGNSQDLLNDSEAIFGDISYGVPKKPDDKILNEMDNIVASFKTAP